MILGTYIVWRFVIWCLWVAVIISVITIAIAAALLTVTVAVFYGLLSPTRTPASALASLVANTEAGIAEIRRLQSR